MRRGLPYPKMLCVLLLPPAEADEADKHLAVEKRVHPETASWFGGLELPFCFEIKASLTNDTLLPHEQA